MNDTGKLVWELVLALFLSWVVCFFCLFRGVKLSGKIVYFTALFPYLVLFILGIRGWMLDGADIGLSYFIKPDISRLSDSGVWRDAAVQVIYDFDITKETFIFIIQILFFNDLSCIYSFKCD